MKIAINDQEFNVSSECIDALLKKFKASPIGDAFTQLDGHDEESVLEFIDFLLVKAMTLYYTLPSMKRLAVMAAVRAGIAKVETLIPGSSAILAPPKKADPVEHLRHVAIPSIVETIVPLIFEELSNGTLKFAASDDAITDVSWAHTD
jgi:hypothetical protein